MEKTQSDSLRHFKIGKYDAESWKMQRPLSVEGCLIMLCERGELEITINSGRYKMSHKDMAFFVCLCTACARTFSPIPRSP